MRRFAHVLGKAVAVAAIGVCTTIWFGIHMAALCCVSSAIIIRWWWTWEDTTD